MTENHRILRDVIAKLVKGQQGAAKKANRRDFTPPNAPKFANMTSKIFELPADYRGPLNPESISRDPKSRKRIEA